MKIWKIAIAGCGYLAENVYLPQMKRIANADAVAICGTNKTRTELLANTFNIPCVFTNITTMLEQCDFDILMDISSIQKHHEINMEALRAGKHVYSQKPFATTVEQATDQIEAAKKSKVKLSVAPIHMIRPELVAVREMLKAGVIGSISLMKISFSHGGPEYYQYRGSDPSWFFKKGAGALFDMGVHALHQITGLLGPAKSVGCLAAISEPARIARSGGIDGKRIKSDEIPDNYIISLDFGNGTLGVVDTGFIQKASKYDLGGFEIYGTKGTIHLGGGVFYSGVAKLEAYIDSDDLEIRGWIETKPWRNRNTDFFQCMCISDLIESIEQNKPTGLPAEQARHVIEIMNIIPQAINERKVVDLKTSF